LSREEENQGPSYGKDQKKTRVNLGHSGEERKNTEKSRTKHPREITKKRGLERKDLDIQTPPQGSGKPHPTSQDKKKKKSRWVNPGKKKV